MRRLLLIPLWTFLLLVLLPRLTPAGEFDSARLATIRDAMQKFVDKEQVAGVVTVVGTSRGIASHEAVGSLTLEPKTEMKKESLFRIASMTKPITAIGIMILVDEGKLSIDDPVEKHLPEFKGLYQSRRNGRGPWAWRRHRLAVPLHDREGSCLGVIFADDPVDRLLPTTESLQALRLFANQATVALEAVAQYEAQRYLAEHDALTALRNRHSFIAELEECLRQSPRRAERIALVYCDLDGFKQLNDARGHSVGDDVLVRFGRVLTESVRDQDSAFRIGGDEFALVLRGCSEDEAKNVDPVTKALAGLAPQGFFRARR